MKPYYADYINHMLRFYARHTCPRTFKSDVDRENYRAVDKVLKTISGKNYGIIVYIFNQNDTIADTILEVSKIHNMKQDEIWSLLSTVTNKIAHERGLI